MEARADEAALGSRKDFSAAVDLELGAGAAHNGEQFFERLCSAECKSECSFSQGIGLVNAESVLGG